MCLQLFHHILDILLCLYTITIIYFVTFSHSFWLDKLIYHFSIIRLGKHLFRPKEGVCNVGLIEVYLVLLFIIPCFYFIFVLRLTSLSAEIRVVKLPVPST